MIEESKVCLFLSAFISGGVTIGLAFLAELFGPLILQVALSIYGMVGGPLLGVFICALFLPMVNSWVSIRHFNSLLLLSVSLALSSKLPIGIL